MLFFSLFLLFLETAETAFVYALSSAAVMHSVAKACSKGELTECGCGKSQPNIRSKSVFKHRSSVTISSMNRASSRSSNDGFEWGGCSDDLKFGRNVSMLFIDRQERLITRRRIVRMVNMHNNEAGRQVRKQICDFFFIGKNDPLLFRQLNEMFN